MNNQRLAYVYALTAVALWSTVSTAFKLTLRTIAPLPLLAGASFVSLVVLGILLTVRKSWPALLALPRKDVLHAAGLGLLNPFLYYTILFMAYELLPAHIAQPVNYTWALMLSLLSVPLLKQKIRLAEGLAMLVAYGGVVVIALSNTATEHDTNLMGIGLALLSTIIWALYWIANTRSTVDPVVNLFINTAFALPCIFLAAHVEGSLGALFNASSDTWLGIGYIGVFEMGITSVLWLTALRLTKSTANIATLIFLAPFLSLIWFQLILKEHIGTTFFMGLVLVIAGSFMQQRLSAQKNATLEGYS